MRQFFQNLSNGLGQIEEIPAPNIKEGHLLIKTKYSLLSSGTERMLVNFAKSNLVNKAKQQPDKVKQVLDKVRTDGLINTFNAVQTKLDRPIPLGYSNVGEVIALGKGVNDFNIGDMVVSNGPHADLVLVPKNLCEIIPFGVSDESASFTVLGAIGLQGIRLAEPTLGETFLVSGLGVIGLLTAQLLASQNCDVLAVDPDKEKCSLAESFGIKTLCLNSKADPQDWCLAQTNGKGVDGVLITASTSSSEPIELAANVCRQRGRIILIGVTGCSIRRDLFYKKELTFQVSCSYGPGRYDSNYEDKGNDYPYGLVRWTEKRNFQAVLNTLKKGLLKTDDLISSRYPFENAPQAYEELLGNPSSLGIVFNYKNDNENILKKSFGIEKDFRLKTKILNKNYLGFIGAGNYAGRILIPAFKKAGANFYSIGGSSGLAPHFLGKKFKFQKISTDIDELINDKEINALVISTRHNSHSELICKALLAGKHVFVEKPLCMNSKELQDIKSIYKGDTILTVGFNRRFAPLVRELKKLIKDNLGPKSIIYTCNAGYIPSDHWTQDPKIGGGRLIGEACHFVDMLRFICGSEIVNISLNVQEDNEKLSDTFTLNLKFSDGSIGTIHYFANGNRAYPKERIEVFVDGKVFSIDNFRKLRAWGVKGFITKKLFAQDKGQINCAKQFINSIEKGGNLPIPIDEIFEVQNSLNNLLKL